MNDREKVLTTFLVIAIISIISLAGALIAVNQENDKYKAIVEVSCQKTLNVSQCKTGMKMLMNMSPEEIKNYGSYGF